MSITAPAAYWDAFRSIEFYLKRMNEPVTGNKLLEFDEDNQPDCQTLGEILSKAVCYSISDNTLYITVPKTIHEIEEETAEKVQECINGINYQKTKLIKWAALDNSRAETIKALSSLFKIDINQ